LTAEEAEVTGDSRQASWLLLFLSSLFLSVASAGERDFGTSMNLFLKATLNDDWFLLSRSNLATRDDNENLFLGYTGFTLGRQLDPNWSLRVGFRKAGIKLSGDWYGEDRPFLEAYYAENLNGFRLSNRARAEWRMFGHRDDDVRLRNEVGIQMPWKLTPLELQPYFEDEVFYSVENGKVEANWLGTGLSWRPAKGTKLKAGYRWNRLRLGNSWQDRDMLVLGISLFY